MSSARRNRRARPTLSMDLLNPLPPSSPQATPRSISPSPLAAVRQELDEMKLERHQLERVENFLFRKSKLLSQDDEEEITPDHFEELNLLGRGNGGSVSKVRHKATNLIIARKAIHLEIKPEVRNSILRELKVLHKCSSPHIIGFYGSFWHEGEINILMEYMDGGSLDAVLQRTGRIPENVLAEIAHSILQGLIYLRDKLSIIHRDVKPSNVLVSTDGDCKLCDFGVSGELHNSLANTFVGTRSYMAPERLRGEEYTVESDVWSLGMSLVEMATGHFPIPASRIAEEPLAEMHPPPDVQPDPESKPSVGMAIFELLAHIVQGEPPEIPVDKGFSQRFHDFVAACLKKDPKQRLHLNDLVTHPWISETRAKQRVDLAKWVQSTISATDLAARQVEKAAHRPLDRA